MLITTTEKLENFIRGKKNRTSFMGTCVPDIEIWCRMFSLIDVRNT